jgi:hypothetical protein
MRSRSQTNPAGSSMSKKLICFDLDGTLLDDQKLIHPIDREILVNYRDILFIPTTGRSRISVRQMFARNGIFADGVIPFPMVLQNGSVIYQANEQLFAYFPYSSEIQNELIRIARGFSQVTFLFLDVNEIHVLGGNEFGKMGVNELDFITVPFSMQSKYCQFSKLMCISDNSSILEKLNNAFACLPVEIAYSMPTILEITPHGVNKGSGLRLLLNALKLNDCLIFAAGDADNDLSILNMAHRSFAPLTSPSHIRAQVHHVIDTRVSGLLDPLIKYSQ